MDMSDLPHAFLHGYKVNYALVDAIMATSGYNASYYSGSRPESQSSADGRSPQSGVSSLRTVTNADAVVSPRLRLSRDLSGIAEITTAPAVPTSAAYQLSSDDPPAWRSLLREYGLEHQGLSIADVEPHSCSTSRTGPIHKGKSPYFCPADHSVVVHGACVRSHVHTYATRSRAQGMVQCMVRQAPQCRHPRVQGRSEVACSHQGPTHDRRSRRPLHTSPGGGTAGGAGPLPVDDEAAHQHPACAGRARRRQRRPRAHRDGPLRRHTRTMDKAVARGPHARTTLGTPLPPSPLSA